MNRRARRLAVGALVAVAALAATFAVIAVYVRHAAVDADQFANRASVALRDDSVRALIAQRITDEVILENRSDLLAARPIIESVVSSIVGGRAFSSLFRVAVRDAHRAILDRDQDTVTLTIGDVGTVVAAALEALRPQLAGRVRAVESVEVLRRDIGSVSAEAARAAKVVRLLAALSLAVAVLCAAAALWLSADRRATTVRLGVGIAVGGIAVVVLCGVARSLAIAQLESPEARAAAGAVFDAFVGDLRTAAWILAGCGAVLAAAAASLIRPVDVTEPLRRLAGRIAAEPAHPPLRVLRGVALVGVGLLCLLARETVLQLMFTAAGVYLIYAGVSAILRLVNSPAAAGAADYPGPRRSQRRRALAAVVVAGALVVGAVSVFVGSGAATAGPPAGAGCNGHEELCERPLNEVALPATHNSMSAPLPGWFSSAQDASIADQLRFGIRGLLIDAHYADRLPSGRLRTDVGDPAQLREQAAQDGVSPDAVDAALRLRARLGFKGQGKRGMYLCHSFCELGGTPLADVLEDLHDFLIANPGEVVVVINQDYVMPADFVDAVTEAGLDDLAYRGPTTGRWPTLGKLIDSNQRVVFLAENHAGEAPWYRLAYESTTQETPYAFAKARQLTAPAELAASCRPNRGPSTAPLFLVNHWITTDPLPLPKDAETVNAYAPLMARLRACEELRGRPPNLVAVNFYRRGNLLRAVDTLNGIR